VEITFKNRRLEKLANDYNRSIRELGPKRAKLFIRRLNDLKLADNLEYVKNLPGKYHELVGDRKGQFACDLDHPYRLIFEPHENPVPIDEHGWKIWIEIKGVEIIEIEDYH